VPRVNKVCVKMSAFKITTGKNYSFSSVGLSLAEIFCATFPQNTPYGEKLFAASPAQEPIVRKEKKNFINFNRKSIFSSTSFARSRRAHYMCRHRKLWRDSILTEKRGCAECDLDLHLEKSNPDLNLRSILKKSRKSFQLEKERNILKVQFKLETSGHWKDASL